MPRTIMLPNNIKLMSKEIAPIFSTDDVAKIKKFCKTQTKGIFDHLSKPLAPNIHGHEYIKKAIFCMLLQGNENVLNNGACTKGDINILLLASAGTMHNRVESCAAHSGETPTDFTNGLHFISKVDGTILLLSLAVTVAVQL